jgi:hypothetical protein
LAKHDEDDLERPKLLNIHSHLATPIDCKAEFVQEDETGDTNIAAEKDSEGIVDPQVLGHSGAVIKSALAGENEPGHEEAGLYNYRYRADDGEDVPRFRFRCKYYSDLEKERDHDSCVARNSNNPH